MGHAFAPLVSWSHYDERAWRQTARVQMLVPALNNFSSPWKVPQPP